MGKADISHFEIKFEIKASGDASILIIKDVVDAVGKVFKDKFPNGSISVEPKVTVIKSPVALLSCYDCEWHTDKCKRNDCSQYDKYLDDIEYCEICGKLDNSRGISFYIGEDDSK